MKTNWQRIVRFSRAAQTYLAENENNKNTKLGYALKRVTSQLEKIQTDYLQRRDDISIDHAAVDGDGVLLIEADGRFRFTRESLKERNKQWRELDEADIFEIEPHFTTSESWADVPHITEDMREAFSGLVIREEESKLEAVA